MQETGGGLTQSRIVYDFLTVGGSDRPAEPEMEVLFSVWSVAGEGRRRWSDLPRPDRKSRPFGRAQE